MDKKVSTRKKSKCIIRLDTDDSRTVVESMVFTRAQTDGNIYRQRFLLRLVELAQNYIHEQLQAHLNGGSVEIDGSGRPFLTLPVRSVLFDGDDKNYSKAKKAILDYLNWVIVIEDDSFFKVRQVIYDPELDKNNSVFQFYLNENIWRGLVDFSKGYSMYNLKIALSLESSFALKIFKMLSTQKVPITYSVEQFRHVFGFEKKYTASVSDLIRFVIDPARKELDAKSPVTFVYTLEYGHDENRPKGRKRITAIEIVPVQRIGNESKDSAVKRLHPSSVIGNDAYHMLLMKFGFTEADVRNNVKLFDYAMQALGQEDFFKWLDSIFFSACGADSSFQGYIISALKIYLRNKFGYEPAAEESSVSGGGAGAAVAVVVSVAEPEPGVEVAAEPARPFKPVEPVAIGENLGENQHHIGEFMRSLFD